MSQTKPNDSAWLAGTLFDDVLTSLANARRAAHAPSYFPSGQDAQADSYFVTSSVTTMRAADFEFPGGGNAEGLIDALAVYWTAQGDAELAAAAPRLNAIAAALRDEAVQDDGSVDIFCYTLF